MPVRCRRASSGPQRCKAMKPKCTDEAEICQSAMALVSMPSGVAHTAGREMVVRWPPRQVDPENKRVTQPRAETTKGQ